MRISIDVEQDQRNKRFRVAKFAGAAYPIICNRRDNSCYICRSESSILSDPFEALSSSIYPHYIQCFRYRTIFEIAVHILMCTAVTFITYYALHNILYTATRRQLTLCTAKRFNLIVNFRNTRKERFGSAVEKLIQRIVNRKCDTASSALQLFLYILKC